MKISTRGRYAIRVMLDLAEHNTGEYIPLVDIAKRQEISEKYLEAIVASLVKSGFLIALRGKKGGYKLNKSPEQITMKDILEITEGAFAPVACLVNTPNSCARAAGCKTLKMWEDLQKLVDDYFTNITLQDLLNDGQPVDEYII